MALSNEELTGSVGILTKAVDGLYLACFAMIVALMQGGFAFLEAGCVRYKNHVCLLFKNFAEIGFGVFAYFATGSAIALPYEKKDKGKFMGYSGFFMKQYGEDTLAGTADYLSWFFQMSFAITATTIVSGCLAERVTLHAVAIYCLVLTGFVYPVAAYWGWDASHGWLFTTYKIPTKYTNAIAQLGGSACGDKNSRVCYPAQDFAGSTIVHITGGAFGLAGAFILGPRLNFKKEDMPGHSALMQALGAFILWFGFLAFNGGSVLTIAGNTTAVGLAMTNTIMASSVGGVAGVAVSKILTGKYLLGSAINGNLSGAVAICCCANKVHVWASMVIGIMAGALYPIWSMIMIAIGVDDPIDAVAVHMMGGIVGMIGMILLSHDTGLIVPMNQKKIERGARAALAAWQMVHMLAGIAWALGTGAATFGLMSVAGILRESDEVQMIGQDVAHHGGLGLKLEVNGERV